MINMFNLGFYSHINIDQRTTHTVCVWDLSRVNQVRLSFRLHGGYTTNSMFSDYVWMWLCEVHWADFITWCKRGQGLYIFQLLKINSGNEGQRE